MGFSKKVAFWRWGRVERNDQEFVWGQDLKKSLNKINEHYFQLSDSDKEKGAISFASDLPQIEDTLIKQFWARLTY